MTFFQVLLISGSNLFICVLMRILVSVVNFAALSRSIDLHFGIDSTQFWVE